MREFTRRILPVAFALTVFSFNPGMVFFRWVGWPTTLVVATLQMLFFPSLSFAVAFAVGLPIAVVLVFFAATVAAALTVND